MKIDYLYIVAVTSAKDLGHAEVVGDAKALHARYSKGGAKQDNVKTVQIVEFHPSGYLLAGWEAERLVWMDRACEPVAKPPLPAKGATVGVYVIGHGGSGKLRSCSPDEVAEMLRELAGPGRLRKVVLLVCGIGSGIERTAEIEWDKDLDDVAVDEIKDEEAQPLVSATYKICKLLIDEKTGTSPMVAGWDDFVSVCYGGMSKTHQPREIRDSFKIGDKGKIDDMGLKNALNTKYLGRKTVEAENNKALPQAEIREAHKIIYFAKDHVVYRRHPARWSDKDVSANAERLTDNNVNTKEEVGKEENF